MNIGVYSIAGVAALLLGLSQGEVAAHASTAEFKIDRTGLVTANLRLDLTPSTEPARLLGILTPCDNPAAQLRKSPDVRAQFLAIGPSYSAVTLLVPGNSVAVPLTIEDCLLLEETSEGKLKVTINYSYAFAGVIEQTLMPVNPRDWQIRVVLPGEFDETLVAYNPSAVARIDRTAFSILNVVPPPPSKAAWIVFPNTPTQRQQYAKLVLGLLLGIITTLVQVPAFRTRRLDLLAGLAGVALLVLSLTVYYAVVLSDRLDLLVWIGASIPHLIVAIVGTIYVAFAKRRQATIAGMVLADDKPALFGRATLLAEKGSVWEPVETTERLDGGKYQFYVWVGGGSLRLKVQAQASGRAVTESKAFSIVRKQQYPVESLECPAAPAVTAPAVTE